MPVTVYFVPSIVTLPGMVISPEGTYPGLMSTIEALPVATDPLTSIR